MWIGQQTKEKRSIILLTCSSTDKRDNPYSSGTTSCGRHHHCKHDSLAGLLNSQRTTPNSVLKSIILVGYRSKDYTSTEMNIKIEKECLRVVCIEIRNKPWIVVMLSMPFSYFYFLLGVQSTTKMFRKSHITYKILVYIYTFITLIFHFPLEQN
jgi:hypothetical protein